MAKRQSKTLNERGNKMDINCRHCGEPLEHDALHDQYDINGEKLTYSEAGRRFKRFGCGLEDQTICDNPMVDLFASIGSATIQDLSDEPEEWINYGNTAY
jgi:hypothetical protein